MLYRSFRKNDTILSADGNVIRYLQEAKNNHMVELAEKLTKDDCELIFEHYNFACLKRIIE